MKKNQKAIMIAIGVLFVVLTVILIIIYEADVRSRENKIELDNTIEENISTDSNAFNDDGEINEEEEQEDIVDNETFKVTNGAYFYTVENCIREYIDNVKKLQKEDSEINRNNLYNKLSKNYIEKNNITLDNVKNINIKDDCYLVGAVEMLQLNIIDNYVMRYSTKTLFLDSNNKTYYFDFIVYLDYANLSFAIEPIGGKDIDLSKINLKTEIEYIEANDYNKYSYDVVTKEDIISNYIEFFKTLCYKVPDIAYMYLNDDCKSSKYPSLEVFKNTILNNESKIKYLQLMVCNDIIEQENNTKYICSSVGGGDIVIYENSIMDFEIELNI